MKKLAVVALGGNALLRGNQTGTIRQQEKNTYNTCINLINLLKNDYGLVITHGNGPQVGNILLRNEAGFNSYKIPRMPLDICVADSQGGIGYMIERQLKNILNEQNINCNVITLISEVIVDLNDPAFKNPTKPIGTFFIKEEAELLMKNNGFVFEEDTQKRGWRRVVPSPEPLEIINKNVIKELAAEGNIVITAGGGGIPVFLDSKNQYQGVEAVIDKDIASSLLASEINADKFYILTDVSHVYINFNKPNQEALETVKLNDMIKYFENGEFSSGSMRPKIKAAINFVQKTGNETIITEATQLNNMNTGTRIIP
ncbi:MAG: carbamate kinase [Ignavibacteria bacterium GWA2_35_9]|nr:MAG: carbamate kinase [Ignavibacteria bacterium GWA2_35_9]OGU47169.1 MAG: carbamate kinase [Ignavibacteria bacterium GWB2_36_8]OGU53303.1 MAG: carbamate kinase [Ignavibacteria bacterium GWC2_36_12]